MKKITVFIATVVSLFLISCGTGMTLNSGYRNSIYYASTEDVQLTPVEQDVTTIQVVDEEESYEAKLHKFDSPTYNIELNLTPWYPSYYWRWNSWCLSPYVYTSIYWDWSWRPYYYYDYWGYYNPYRYSYRYYYPYRYSHYWDWHRPYYTYYHHKPSHRPGRDVYYTRRGGMSGPTPSHRVGSSNRSNRTVYRSSSSRPRQATSSRDNSPTRRATVSRSSSSSRNATVSRSGSQPRQTTTSRKTNVRYNSSARPVSRSQSQADRTGYSRSTTNNRSSNTGRTYYNNGPSQRTQPSVRYSERSTSSQNSGISRSSSGGSTTRRK